MPKLDIKFDIKTAIVVATFLVGVAGVWFDSKSDARNLSTIVEEHYSEFEKSLATSKNDRAALQNQLKETTDIIREDIRELRSQVIRGRQ